jgi:predicted secreted protein
MKTVLFALALSLLIIPVAHAQNSNGLNLPPEGQTVINFSATETKTVPQDLLIASLRIEVEEKDPTAIQKKINEAMTKALGLAKGHSDIKTSTGTYSVYKYEEPIETDPKTGKHKTVSKWRGSQTIDMKSKETTKLLDLTGKIQELGFAMNNLSYTVSPELLEATRDELLTAALKKLQSKAGIVAKTLDKTAYDLVDVNVDTGGPVMPMMYAKAAMARSEMVMDAGMPAPVAEAGESDISLTVSARALIK